MAASSKCFYCDKISHQKINCLRYLNDKKTSVSTSGIYFIKVNYVSTTSWVFNTDCGSHICTNVLGLTRSRKLTIIEVELRVVNAVKFNSSSWNLQSTFTFTININTQQMLLCSKCNKNIISIHELDQKGYSFYYNE